VDGCIRLVDLVEKQKARDLLSLNLPQNQLQLRNLLLVELAHDHSRIYRGKRRAHLVHELDRAGTIDEGVIIALETRSGDRELDAHLVVARFLAGIADAVARVHRPLPLDCAGPGENRFKQGRLAALERAHQRNAPWTRSSCAVLCHIASQSTEVRPFAGPFAPSFQHEGGIGKGR